MNFLEELKTTSIKNVESFVSWLETLHGDNVKWKHQANANQIVFKTNDNYYYKVYAFNEVDKFNSLIRHAFAEVYRSYGIDWEIVTIKTDKGFLDIERREKLEVFTEWHDDILLNYANTLELVEEKLCFRDIVKQIKTQYKFVHKLKLVRHCVNNPMDYAIYKGKLILLDDADWCLYMLDLENNPISTCSMFIKINLFDEEYAFTHLFINPQKVMMIDKIYEMNDKFFLFKRLDIITRQASIKENFQKMLSNNINLLTSKRDKDALEELSSIYSPLKKFFYCVDSIDDIDYNLYNKVVVRQQDINKNKILWDNICYEYVNRNLCSIHIHTSFYDDSINDLFDLLDQASLYSIYPKTGYEHTGIFLRVQWNIIKDNYKWDEHFYYIKQRYPNVKIIVDVILNQPFIQKNIDKEIDIATFMSDIDAIIQYGTKDDTPKELYPRRKTMLEFLNYYNYDYRIYLKLFKSKMNFEEELNSCGHNKNNYLPYYDSDKCCICDWKALGNLL